jgi:hypothetical protein
VYDWVYGICRFESNRFTLFVIVGVIGYATAGAFGSVGESRSRIGSAVFVLSRCSVTWMPWFAPNTPVKSDMPGRWYASAKPPRITLSPSCEPKIARPMPPFIAGSCQARPRLGPKLFLSTLYA